mgnify:CR=1 FL=1
MAPGPQGSDLRAHHRGLIRLQSLRESPVQSPLEKLVVDRASVPEDVLEFAIKVGDQLEQLPGGGEHGDRRSLLLPPHPPLVQLLLGVVYLQPLTSSVRLLIIQEHLGNTYGKVSRRDIPDPCA